MKKTILSFLLVGSAAAVMAQQPSSTNPNTRYNQNPNTNLNQNSNTNLNNNNSLNNPVNNQPNTSTNNNTPPTNINSPETDTAYREQPYQPMNTNTMNNNTMIEANTNTYSVAVPTSIQTTFTTSYPGVTGTWARSGDWYQARYVENGAIKQVMYREDGKVLTSSISPIKQSFVSDEMVAQAIQRYGASLYSIGTSKGADGKDIYRVTVIENGQAKTEWMNADGSTADDHFRKAEEMNSTIPADQNTNSQQPAEAAPVDSSQQRMNSPEQSSSPERMNEQSSQPEDMYMDETENRDHGCTDENSNEIGINNATSLYSASRRR